MGDFGSEVPPGVALPPLTESVSTSTDEDIHVIVTGFGPFKSNPLNPSFFITAALPSTIKIAASPTSTSRTVRFHAHPYPIQVSYSAVQSAVPALLESFRSSHNGQTPHLILHIGMASSRHYYSVETRAHRDGYRVTDVQGQTGYLAEVGWRAAAIPEILQPGLSSVQYKGPKGVNPLPPDLEFLETWRSSAPSSADIRLSDDAGRYLCEFIYYASMALAYKERRSRNAIFLHVPGWTDEASIETGKEVTIGLIKTLVMHWIDQAKPPQ